MRSDTSDGLACWQLVPFRIDIPDILRETHIATPDNHEHNGRQRMMIDIERDHFLAGAQKKVNTFIKDTCQCCMDHFPANSKPVIHPIYSSEPLERVVIDTTKLMGFVAALVCCHFTKYVWGELFKTKEGEPIAKWFNAEFQKDGFPDIYHSDNGGELRNHWMRDANKLRGTKEVKSQPYNPRCQGLIEVRNNTIKRKVKQRLTRCHKGDVSFEVVQKVLRDMIAGENSAGTSTYPGFTPFFLLRGRWDKPSKGGLKIPPNDMKCLWQWMRQQQKKIGKAWVERDLKKKTGDIVHLDVGVAVRVKASKQQRKSGRYAPWACKGT
jgi:hypothetical protein